MMSILWALISIYHLPVFEVDTFLRKLKPTHLEEILLHHLGKTAEIIIFLLGAMTIVEIIDYFNGFATIKGFIKTKSRTLNGEKPKKWPTAVFKRCVSNA